MAIIDDQWISLQKDSLEKNVKAVAGQGMWSLITGGVFLIVGLAFASFVYSNAAEARFCFYSRWFCDPQIYWPAIISVLAEAASIILFIAYRSSLKQAGYYRNELLVLRDLILALKICENISENDFEKTTIVSKDNNDNKTILKHKSQKSKTMEQIIETLLNRCSN